MPVVAPPSILAADRESHILDGLDFTDGTVFDLVDAPVFTPAPIRLDWVGGVDSDGTIPLDAGHSDNATLTLPLRVVKQDTYDLAWHKTGLLVAKLEATRRSRNGLQHIWTPKGATDSWLLTVRSGEIAEMPMASRGDLVGYLLRAHRFTVVLTCDPFLYRDGELIEYEAVTSTEPVFSILLEDVPGHVDAEATVTVTDDATQPRRHVEGGMGENSAAPLLIDSASLDVTGFAGSATTRTGAYSANGVIRATLATQPQAVCGTGALGHVGAHRVKARAWATSLDVRLRLAYRTGDGDYSYTPWQTPAVASNFAEVDFGTITIDEVTSGAQEWDGRIEAYSTTVGDTLDIDFAGVLPIDRYWKVRTPYLYRAGLLVARDEFTGITAGTALHGRVAPLGGTWATSGATTDLTAADAPLATDETMSRATASDTYPGRKAILGSTDYIDIETGVDFYSTPDTGAPRHYPIVRYVDASNFLRAEVSATNKQLLIWERVGGSETLLGVASTGIVRLAWFRLRIVAFASGYCRATLLSNEGTVLVEVAGWSSTLATGGALATGKIGFGDYNSAVATPTRYYDNFYAATPPAEKFAMYADRSIEIRHDSCERESADGLTWGSMSPRGGRVYVPCSGDEGRSTRLWIKARRNDVEVTADANIADSTTVSVTLRPRYRLPTMP